MNLSMSCAKGLFSEDIFKSGLDNLEDVDSILQGGRGDQISLEGVSCEFFKTQRSGKNKVWFDLVFIKCWVYPFT